MTLAVPPEHLAPFMELMKRRDVEATVIGEFTGCRCVVEYHGKVVMDVGLAFLHDGLPKNHLKTTYTKKAYPEPAVPCPERLDSTLKAMLQRRNICSKEFISIQYDDTVQGGHVLGPLQGRGRVQGVSSLTKVLPGAEERSGAVPGDVPFVCRNRPVSHGRGRD